MAWHRHHGCSVTSSILGAVQSPGKRAYCHRHMRCHPLIQAAASSVTKLAASAQISSQSNYECTNLKISNSVRS